MLPGQPSRLFTRAEQLRELKIALQIARAELHRAQRAADPQWLEAERERLTGLITKHQAELAELHRAAAEAPAKIEAALQRVAAAQSQLYAVLYRRKIQRLLALAAQIQE